MNTLPASKVFSAGLFMIIIGVHSQLEQRKRERETWPLAINAAYVAD